MPALGFDREGLHIETSRSLGVDSPLSGGGSRAFSSALGAYRALFDLGLLATTRHVVAVSGGTWFARCATV